MQLRMRYTVRALLTLVTILCISLGCVLRYARQRANAIASIKADGGYLGYAHLSDVSVDGLIHPVNGAQRGVPVRQWLRRVFGDALFVRVRFIDYSFRRNNSAPVTLSPLAYVGEVKSLILRNCRVSSEQLRELRKLRKLEAVDLSWTDVDDDAAAALQYLPSLVELDISHTAVTDRALEHVGQLTSLQNLLLNETQVTDRGLHCLANLRHLLEIDLAGTNVTGKSLLLLSPTLENINLSGTCVTDRTLPELRRFTNLTTLSLNNTRVTDAICSKLTDVVHLSYLDVSWTYASDGIRREVLAISKAVHVEVGTRVPDDEEAAISHLVGKASTGEEVIRLSRVDESCVEVYASTREGQLNDWGHVYTLRKMNGTWEVLARDEVDVVPVRGTGR